MDIDKLIPADGSMMMLSSFSSLMDIDKLIPRDDSHVQGSGFSSLMDIDKLILNYGYPREK